MILAHFEPLTTDAGKKDKVVLSFGSTIAAYVLAIQHDGEDAISRGKGDSAAT